MFLAGIGIDIDLSASSFINPPYYISFNSIKNSVDSAIAFSIDYHVIQAYRYLVQTYNPNDKIYLFGFSRGSFIARILAGMIEKIGLIDKGLESMVKTAWEIYKNWEQIGQPDDLIDPSKCSYSLRNFKQTFCRYNVSIEFMGLFDSINSCGILLDRLFPFTSNSSNVKHIRHAVSIHERRSKFKQNLFAPHSYLPQFLSNNISSECSISNNKLSPSSSKITLPNIDSITRSHNVTGKFSRKCSNDLLEVWFPGDHSDIGGNWPYDDNGNMISNLPFKWILSYALEFGIQFKKNSIDEFNSKFNPMNTVLSFQHDVLSFKNYKYPYYVNPLCSSQQDELAIDLELGLHSSGIMTTVTNNNANISSSISHNIDDTLSLLETRNLNYNENLSNTRSPLFPDFSRYIRNIKSSTYKKVNAFKGHGDSSLFNTFLWWFLEIIPIGYFVENKKGRWRSIYWPNFGEKRNIPKQAIVHWSILWRLKFIEDVDFSNLPEIFQKLENIINNEEISQSNFSDDISYTEIDRRQSEHDTMVLKLEDIVNLKSGTIRLDLDKIITEAFNLNKKVILDIDWENPPNELSVHLSKQ